MPFVFKVIYTFHAPNISKSVPGIHHSASFWESARRRRSGSYNPCCMTLHDVAWPVNAKLSTHSECKKQWMQDTCHAGTKKKWEVFLHASRLPSSCITMAYACAITRNKNWTCHLQLNSCSKFIWHNWPNKTNKTNKTSKIVGNSGLWTIKHIC